MLDNDYEQNLIPNIVPRKQSQHSGDIPECIVRLKLLISLRASGTILVYHVQLPTTRLCV